MTSIIINGIYRSLIHDATVVVKAKLIGSNEREHVLYVVQHPGRTSMAAGKDYTVTLESFLDYYITNGERIGIEYSRSFQDGPDWVGTPAGVWSVLDIYEKLPDGLLRWLGLDNSRPDESRWQTGRRIAKRFDVLPHKLEIRVVQ